MTRTCPFGNRSHQEFSVEPWRDTNLRHCTSLQKGGQKDSDFYVSSKTKSEIRVLSIVVFSPSKQNLV